MAEPNGPKKQWKEKRDPNYSKPLAYSLNITGSHSHLAVNVTICPSKNKSKKQILVNTNKAIVSMRNSTNLNNFSGTPQVLIRLCQHFNIRRKDVMKKYMSQLQLPSDYLDQISQFCYLQLQRFPHCMTRQGICLKLYRKCNLS